MKRAHRWSRSAISITGRVLVAVAVSSCAQRPASPSTLDLSAATLDTILTLDDDRTAIVGLATASGSTVLLGDTAPFVEVIGRSGDPSARFGAAGDGPGEFKFPSGIASFDDSIAVWDPSSARLTIADRSGHLLRTRSATTAIGKIAPRMLRDGFGGAGRIAATPDGIVIAAYAGTVRQPMGLWSIALVRIRPDGTLDTLPAGFPSVEQLRTLNGDAQELVAVPLWASCGPLGIATWDPVAGKLRRYTTTGTPQRSDSVRGQSVALTDDLIRVNLRYQLDGLLSGKRPDPAVYDQMIESMLEQSRGAKHMFPGTAPAFVSMQCDDVGTVWLQQFSLADAGSGMGRTWTLVDAAGELSTVRLPSELRVLHIGNGMIYGMRRGTEGQLVLVTFAVPAS